MGRCRGHGKMPPMSARRTSEHTGETDALDVPWSELATPAGRPAPNEKRRQRARAAEAARRAAARGAKRCGSP